MEASELKKRLLLLGAVAKTRIPNLNKGGCGVFAHAVAKELRELGVESEVVVNDYGDDFQEFLDSLKALQEGAGNHWDFAGWLDHLGVRFKLGGKWFTYDSDALLEGREWFGFNPALPATEKGLTPEQAGILVREVGCWNPTFNRRYIPKVRKLVKEVLTA